MSSTNSRFLTQDRIGALELANRAVDVLSLVLAALVASHLRPAFAQNLSDGLLLFSLNTAITLFVFQQSHLYRSWRGRPLSDQFSRLLLAIFSASLMTVVVWKLLGIDQSVPVEAITNWLFIAGSLLILQRTLLHVLFRSLRALGSNSKRVLLVGGGELSRTIFQQCKKSPETGFEIIGVLDHEQGLANNDEPDRLGTLSDLSACLSRQKIDEVWIALPLSEMTQAEHILTTSEQYMVCARLFPDIYSFNLLNHSTSELLGFPVIDLSVNQMDGANKIIKEIEDRVLSTFFLLISAPLMILIALIVRWGSPGPAIFRQRRYGLNGEAFTIYKFRTMFLGPDSTPVFSQAKKDDPRFTPIGKWLRRTSLDELPQLINVLQGKMSLVGPRPHAIEQDDFFKEKIPGYKRRNRIKPGITGWAQVNDFRGEVFSIEDMAERVKHDLYYIEHWSLWFDFRIIIATILKIFLSKKAW